jgi:hypothetical protein
VRFFRKLGNPKPALRVRALVLRRDRVTWTGYIRDTVVFSILDYEWPAVKLRLEERLARFT